MGRDSAALAVVTGARYEMDIVHSPGGYLRELTARARRGELRLEASLHALIRTKLRKGSIC